MVSIATIQKGLMVARAEVQPATCVLEVGLRAGCTESHRNAKMAYKPIIYNSLKQLSSWEPLYGEAQNFS
jgi:hypothetical protein